MEITHTKRRGDAVALVILGVALASVASPATAQEAAPSEPGDEGAGAALDEEAREPTPPLSFRLLPFLKLGFGTSLYPGQEPVAGFDLDVLVGARYELTHGARARLELVPELGYAYHHGEPAVLGHYGLVGLGLRYGGAWFAVSTVTALALGQRNDEFDLGVRAGLRLEAFLGFLGLEVSWEYRTLGGEDLQALRIVLLLDAGVVAMPITLTRMGWAFRRRPQSDSP